MIIQTLTIRNFRNYRHTTINFDSGIHVIIGKNGQGKTNLLESIYYLSCTKSHRIKDDQDLINKESTFFNLEAVIEKQHKKIEIRCNVNENGKNLFLYRNPIHKVSDFIGFFNAVMFCPDDMNLFSSTPKTRRKFIDLELGKLSKTYTQTLNNYYKVLKERNMYLKNSSVNEMFIDTLDEQLIQFQVRIIKQRKKFLEDILQKSKTFYGSLSDDQSYISYEYLSDITYSEDKDLLYQDIKAKYIKNRGKDILLKQTSIGIHKDDFCFYINEQEVNKFASQGQKRILILSLKLGIVYAISEIVKEYPVLILDDVFSELDEQRRKKLLMLLPNDIQIFISTTDLIEINQKKNIKYWNVENGNILEIRRNNNE